MSAPSERQLAGNQRRSLRAIRVKLLAMAEAWDGIDQFNMTQLTDLADKAEQVACEMVAEEAEK